MFCDIQIQKSDFRDTVKDVFEEYLRELMIDENIIDNIDVINIQFCSPEIKIDDNEVTIKF